MSEEEWTTECPTETGTYWFYSYRYGKKGIGKDNKPELMVMNVFNVSNGIMRTADGQFVYESEVEHPYFQKAILPDLPKLNGD